MSDHLPIEIQENIIKRLPLKPVIQFRSVSKSWKSLIDSSRFISEYNAQNTHLQHHLLVKLVKYDDHEDICQTSYVSIVDDATFPNQRVSITHPPLVNMLESRAIIGSSCGLVCVQGYYDEGAKRTNMVVLWNISIRKAVAVVVPNVADAKEMKYQTFIGFGVCRETNDPKIVKILQIWNWKDMETVTCIPNQVEVFTLSTGAWRSPHSNSNLLRKSIQLDSRQSVEGFCYWLATDRSAINSELDSYNLIISFDMTSEEFKEISLPDNLVYYGSTDLYISNLRESLVVLHSDESDRAYDVWRMEDGVPNSFTKLFTICTPCRSILRVLEFRNTGEPIIEIVEDHHDPYLDSVSLAVYEPSSKHISKFGFDGISSFYVYSYKESLLLLDQPEFTIYDKGKRHIAEWRAENSTTVVFQTDSLETLLVL